MENTKVQTTVEARRSFLKKAGYVAPALMLLGSLEAHAAPRGSKIKANNGFGNGDQTAPGGSTTTNGAENNAGGGNGKK